MDLDSNIKKKVSQKLREVAYYDYDLDDADNSLYKYTRDSWSRFGIIEYWDELMYRYGNEKPMTIYRGLNFDTKEQYEKFLSDISDGKMTTKNLSSWSPQKDVAQQFAQTKPSYMEFMTREKMSLIQQQSDKGERITGYRGVILKTSIKKGVGIDVRRFPHGAESEVILPAGTYSVTYKEELTYKDMIGDDIDGVIEKLSKRKDNEALISYLQKNYEPEDLKDSTRHKLFLLTTRLQIKTSVVRRKDWSVRGENPPTTYVIYADMTTPKTHLMKYYLPEDIERIKRLMTPKLKSVIKEVYSQFTLKDKINWRFNHTYWIDFLGLSEYYAKYAKEIGQEYNKKNSREEIKRINSLKGKEYVDAIKAHADDILRLLSNL